MTSLGSAIQVTRWMGVMTLVLAAACLKLNPGFDGEVSGATTGATSGASSGPTLGSGPTTDTAATSSEMMPLPTTSTGSVTTTGAVTGTGSTGETSNMSSGTDDTTTGGPADCWDLGVDTWTLAPLELLPDIRAASLSPDALTLHYRAFVNGEWTVYRTTRPTVDDGFEPAGEAFYPSSTNAADYPQFIAATQELFFTGESRDVYIVKHDGMSWGAATVASGVQAFGFELESHKNVTADGAMLLFQREDGPGFGQFLTGYNFYQLQRDPQTQAVFPDAPPKLVTPVDPGFGLLVCPTLSPDGLHLFFGGLDSAGGGEGDANDGRGGVWYTHRDAVGDDVWLDITRSQQLREVGRVTCPVSVSADGCHLTLLYFLIDVEAPSFYRIARRGDG